MTLADLVGIWRHDYGNGVYEEWIYASDGWLTHRNYKGKIVRSRYSFSQGVIIVHHTPQLVNNYDEDITITTWKGQEMVWRSMYGTTLSAKRN